jgi:hypothetical protein
MFLCMRWLYPQFSSSTHVFEYAKHISIPFDIWRVKNFGQNNMRHVMVHRLCMHKTHVFICTNVPLRHWPKCDHKKDSFSKNVFKSLKDTLFKEVNYERMAFRNFEKYKKSNKWKFPMNSWISSRNFHSFNSSALFKCHLVHRMFVLLRNCKYDFSWIQYPFPKVFLHTLCYNWFPTHGLRFLKA